MKIATYNISGGFYIGDESTEYLDRAPAENFDNKMLSEVIDVINQKNIDIICFQEIITTKEVKYIETIVENTNLKNFDCFELHNCNLVKDTRNGLAILSKYPITKTVRGFFPNPLITKTTSSGKTYNLYNKGYMISEIDVNGKKLQILNHHGFPFRRFNSAANLNQEVFNHFNDIIKTFKPDYIVGDFNTEDYTELTEELKNNYSKTVNSVSTVDGKSFDEVLVKNGVKTEVETMKLLSDHFLEIVKIY